MKNHTLDNLTPPPPMDLEKVRNERSLGKQALNEILKPDMKMLRVGQVLAGLAAALTVVPFWSLNRIGEVFSTGHGATQAWPYVIVLAVSFLATSILSFVALGLTHGVDTTVNARVRTDMIHALSRAPLSWFSTRNSGKVRKALQDDLGSIHMLIAHGPVETVQAAVTPLVLVIYGFVIDWRLGLVMIAPLPIYIAIQAWTMRDMGDKTVEMDARLGNVSATMVEFVTGIAVVKAFGITGKAHKRYIKAAREFSQFYLAWAKPLMFSSAISAAFVSIPVLLLINIGAGAWMVNNGWVSPTQVLVTTLIALIVPGAIQTIGSGMWAYQLAAAAALRVRDTLHPPQLVEPDHGQTPTRFDIVYDHVSFSYGDTLAVDDVSFTCPQSTVTALVGPSGSGKSTLATLAARFCDPDAGRITIGGVDIRDIPTAELYRCVAFVLQDPQLLRMSVRDNIALAKPNASDEQVEQAARAACIYDDIAALPDGFDTIIGEGIHLSGGQQQRIAIARALVVDAPILILDEATAFTDPESEARIQRGLTNLAKGRTVLVIAHRPESVIGADQIVVLTGGKITGIGTHDELKDNPGYRRLWQVAEARFTRNETEQ